MNTKILPFAIIALIIAMIPILFPVIGNAATQQPDHVQENSRPETNREQTPLPDINKVSGTAVVIGVDQPGNCLRIRSGPGSSYDVIGCANMSEELNLTGVWTSNNWAQLTGDGWVFGNQIETDLRPPLTDSGSRSYVAEPSGPIYYENYVNGYPEYGYSTTWLGGIPVFVYDSNVWWRFSPWWWRNAWWWKHHDRDWWRDRHNANWKADRNTINNFNRNRNFSNNNRNLNNINRDFGTRNLNRSNVIRNNAGVNNFRRHNLNTRNLQNSNSFRQNSNSFRQFNPSVLRSQSNFQPRGMNFSGSQMRMNPGFRNFSGPRFNAGTSFRLQGGAFRGGGRRH